MRSSGGGGGGTQVERHEDQYDHAEDDDEGSDGKCTRCDVRAQPAAVRAAVPALLAIRAEDTVVAHFARGVAVISAA